ncbi:MAG TPA: methyltransferase domain-containing protein [Vicinamibacterales bacterium]|nr:methyltransferase domain-containing protein [Vicinamibacterales bacterium]
MHRFCVVATAIAVACLLAGTAHAQLASRPAAEWTKTLEAPERVAGLRADQVIAKLNLKPTDVVADLGAGTGLFSLPLAKAVPSGKVYSVELDEGFLAQIGGKAKTENVRNIVPVLGKFTDPSLPARDVDVAFFHDVLHHVENRAAYLKSVAGYLKPGGRIVVIEFNPGDSPHKAEPALIVSKEQTAGWMADAGLVQSEEIQLFPDKYFVVFRRK